MYYIVNNDIPGATKWIQPNEVHASIRIALKGKIIKAQIFNREVSENLFNVVGCTHCQSEEIKEIIKGILDSSTYDEQYKYDCLNEHTMLGFFLDVHEVSEVPKKITLK